MHPNIANNKVRAVGNVHLLLKDGDGRAIVDKKKCNMVVNGGLQLLAAHLAGQVTNNLSHIAVGTGTAPAAGTQTALSAELSRIAFGSASMATTTVANDSVMFAATFNPGVATGAITETGLFNAATDGSMFSRTVFDVINKGPADTLTITWVVQFN